MLRPAEHKLVIGSVQTNFDTCHARWNLLAKEIVVRLVSTAEVLPLPRGPTPFVAMNEL